MKNEFFKDTRLLDAIDHIDSTLIAETADSIRPPASPKREAEQSKKTKVFTAWKQAAALVACALLMGAIIPAISMLIGNIAPAGSNYGDGISPSGGQSESLESEPIEAVNDGSEGLLYEISEDGKSAMFVGFGTCTDEDVVIASTYNGVPVTMMVDKNILSYEKIQLAGSEYAKSITISDSVQVISFGIFEFCPNLEKIYLGANVRHVRFYSTYPYEHCITEIKVSPENPYFFVKDNCLIKIESKTLILAYGEAVIPDDGSVATIGALAFANYPYKSITIPEGITTIESMAFSGSSLESIVFPKSLKTLQDHAFVDCENLKNVDLNGYKEVPYGTFYDAKSLSEIIGLENITAIGDYAFCYCESLTSIDLGANLTEIGQQAFYANLNLSTINFAGTVEQWNAVKKGVGWNTLMDEPDSQAKIPVEFINCSDGTAKP